jgi:hypothetical protein
MKINEITNSKSIKRSVWKEAFDISRRARGEIKFKTSSIRDPHILSVIAEVSKKTGVPPKEIVQHIQDKVSKLTEIQKYSPILYDIAVKNAVESAAFDLVADVDNQNFEKFNPLTFDSLIKLIRREHRQFFPVRQPGSHKYVYGFNPILVPTKNRDLSGYNSVSTAAATPRGEFIFNIEFMQKLMDWATIEHLVPQGKKYISNGGVIPDCYGYIEFLIVHELLHFSYGDFNYGKQMPEFSHQVHNMASDFRSNYMLIKNGYSQLPIGLYSDDVNSDRQESYREMAQLVHDELKKLPQNLQNLVPKPADDHSSPPEPSPLEVGDLVKNKDTGEIGRITKINRDGSLETELVDPNSLKEEKAHARMANR